MNASFDVLFEIAWRFASLSLLAIGGINALLPEFHRIVVDVEGWMTSAEFADLFALAQLAPGPNAMVVSLLGWKVAGIAGAFVATLAACGPSSLLMGLLKAGAGSTPTLPSAYDETMAHRRSQLAPGAGNEFKYYKAATFLKSLGLVLASGYTLARATDRSVGTVVLTVASAAAIAGTRVNPIWILAAAAIAGIAGVA